MVAPATGRKTYTGRVSESFLARIRCPSALFAIPFLFVCRAFAIGGFPHFRVFKFVLVVSLLPQSNDRLHRDVIACLCPAIFRENINKQLHPFRGPYFICESDTRFVARSVGHQIEFLSKSEASKNGIFMVVTVPYDSLSWVLRECKMRDVANDFVSRFLCGAWFVGVLTPPFDEPVSASNGGTSSNGPTEEMRHEIAWDSGKFRSAPTLILAPQTVVVFQFVPPVRGMPPSHAKSLGIIGCHPHQDVCALILLVGQYHTIDSFVGASGVVHFLPIRMIMVDFEKIKIGFRMMRAPMLVSLSVTSGRGRVTGTPIATARNGTSPGSGQKLLLRHRDDLRQANRLQGKIEPIFRGERRSDVSLSYSKKEVQLFETRIEGTSIPIPWAVLPIL